MSTEVTLEAVLAEITRQGIETRKEVKTEISRLESRIDGLEKHVNEVKTHLGTKIDAVAKDMKGIREHLANVTERVHRLENPEGPTA